MKKARIISIVLFAFAGLLTIYSIWAFVHCQNYISKAMSSGQLVANGNEYDIVNFYVSNCVQYLVYAVLLAAMGYITAKSFMEKPGPLEAPAPKPQHDDNELDAWFEEMRD